MVSNYYDEGSNEDFWESTASPYEKQRRRFFDDALGGLSNFACPNGRSTSGPLVPRRQRILVVLYETE